MPGPLDALQLGTPDLLSSGGTAALQATQPQGPQGPAATSPEMLKQLLQAMGGPTMQGPLTTMQPTPGQPSMPPQFQSPGAAQIPVGTFGSVGERQRADYQATLSNLATFGKAATDYIQAKRVREYSSRIEQVMGAQQGLQQGYAGLQAALQSNDPAAKANAQEAIKHNQALLTNLMTDPKTSKILQKAFNVKLIGDDKGRATPEYQALQQALKSKDQAKAQAAGAALLQRFQAQMPMTAQVSPQLQVQAQLVKAGLLPSADSRVTAMSRVADAIIQSQGRIGAADINRQASLLLAGARLAEGRLSNDTKLQLERDKHADKMIEIQSAHKLAMQELNPLKQAQMLQDLGKTIDGVIGSVKMDASGNVVQSTGLEGAIARNNKEVSDIWSKMGFWGRVAARNPLFLSNEDKESLRRITALRQDNEVLKNEIKTFDVTKIGIGKASAGVAARGVYGGAGADNTTGVSEEPTGIDDEGGGIGEEVDRAEDLIERSFGDIESDKPSAGTPK